jgi:ABC-type spermidine/putrescine transport system permease subunit II
VEEDVSTALKSPEVKVPRSASEISRALQRRRIRIGLLFVSPWILGFLAFFLYPFFATLFYSFTNYTGIGHAHLIGFANYWALFHDSLFRTSLFNTVYYTAVELPLSTSVALGLALLLNMNVRGQQFYRTVFYIPSIVPLVASCMIFVWIFNPTNGIMNSLLSDAHLPSPDWFFSVAWSKPSFILLGLWGLGQPMVIYLAALQGVPKDMYVAAVPLRHPAHDQPDHPVQRCTSAGPVRLVLHSGSGHREPGHRWSRHLHMVLRPVPVHPGVPVLEVRLFLGDGFLLVHHYRHYYRCAFQVVIEVGILCRRRPLGAGQTAAF